MKDTKKTERNWVEYNARLVRSARIELYISQDLLENWHEVGVRSPGGVKYYPDAVIEAGFCIKEVFGLGLRQTEGFLSSLVHRMLGVKREACRVPHYTTLCRRMRGLDVKIGRTLKRLKPGMVIAIDSTGLAIHKQDSWNNKRYRPEGKSKFDRWRKLHICIDVTSGMIVSAEYSDAREKDHSYVPALLNDVPTDLKIEAACMDKAYDTVTTRKLLQDRSIKERIDIRRDARPSRETSYKNKYATILQTRDWQIDYIRHNTINNDEHAARKRLKQLIDYHKRSLVESKMWSIKSHASMYLSAKREDNRAVQAKIKCKIANTVLTA